MTHHSVFWYFNCSDRHGEQGTPDRVSSDNKTVQCGTAKQYCYTSWVLNDHKNKSNIVVNFQGNHAVQSLADCG